MSLSPTRKVYSDEEIRTLLDDLCSDNEEDIVYVEDDTIEVIDISSFAEKNKNSCNNNEAVPSPSYPMLEDLEASLGYPSPQFRPQESVPDEVELCNNEAFLQDPGAVSSSFDPMPDVEMPDASLFGMPFQQSDSQESDSESDLPLEERLSGWFSTRPVLPKIPFTRDSGDKVDLTAENYGQVFTTLFTPEIMNYIVEKSNDYAIRLLTKDECPKEMEKKWKDITIEEFKIFVGILYLMGIIRLNRFADYWRTDYLFCLSVRNFMTRDRFLLILRALHFTNVENDSLEKINPLIYLVNNRVNEIYTPTRNLSIDESMVLWRGALYFRQYVQGKRHKYGIKLYVLAETNGMILGIHLYGGSSDKEVGGKGHAAKVVKKLMEHHTGYGHSLYMDNFYNDVNLANALLVDNIYTTGTLRNTRKGNPAVVTGAKLKRGESFSRYNRNGVCVTKWHDKRDVSILSSEWSGNLIEAENRFGHISMKPECIVKYNENMKGVDRSDQMLSYYPCSHKTIRWYKKLGIHIFQILLSNARFYYNGYYRTALDQHFFQLEIVKFLLPPPPLPPMVQPKTKIHLPTLIPKKGPKGDTKRRRCVHCYKKKVRKDTTFYCSDCQDNPALCLECFREFHFY